MSDSTLYQVDAFTDIPFRGNPAWVMILSKPIDNDAWMQSIANEMNLSETAFIEKTDEWYFSIRYFTPTKEIPLCGHATLASAHILYELGLVNIKENILFKTHDRELVISHEEEGIVLNFPLYSLHEANAPKEFSRMIGFEPREFYTSDYDWKIAIGSEEDIWTAEPKFDSLTELGLGHLMITAESNDPDYDYIVRCFVPMMGINEDPVTGSAQCALAPLWNRKTGKTSFRVKQVSKRWWDLGVALMENAVKIIGRAVTVMKIELL